MNNQTIAEFAISRAPIYRLLGEEATTLKVCRSVPDLSGVHEPTRALTHLGASPTREALDFHRCYPQLLAEF